MAWGEGADGWSPPSDAPAGFGAAPTWGYAPVPEVAPRKTMTRGWAWTALVLLLLIPVGVALCIAWVVVDEIHYEPDPDVTEEWWVLGFAILFAFLWTCACGVAAFVSAVIGAVRARRHPEIRQAPAVAVVVWVFLAILAAPFVVSMVFGAIGSVS